MPDFENEPAAANKAGRAVGALIIVVGIAMIIFGGVGLFSPIGMPEKIFSAFFLVGGALTMPPLVRWMTGRFTFYARPLTPLYMAALFMIVGTLVFLTLEWREHM